VLDTTPRKERRAWVDEQGRRRSAASTELVAVPAPTCKGGVRGWARAVAPRPLIPPAQRSGALVPGSQPHVDFFLFLGEPWTGCIWSRYINTQRNTWSL
jgi:hypothetical protein